MSTKSHSRLSPANVFRRAAVVAVAAAAFFAMTGAQALASPVTCGDTITTDTTLDRDLVDCADNGIVIGADNITLSLRGHTIDGDGALVGDCPAGETCDVGIDNSAGHDGVTVRGGGSVREFAAGVVVLEARGTRVLDLSASHNQFVGIVVGQSADSRVERSSSIDNDEGSAGIVLFGSQNGRIERNSVSGNGDAGIVISGSEDSRIATNSVSDQPFGGIVLDGDDRTVVTGNRVVRNGDAILVSGDDNSVVHNLIADAFGCEDGGCGAGIAVEGGARNLVAGNQVARAAREGIRVNDFDPEAPVTGTVIRGNVVRTAGVDGIAVATEAEAPGIVMDTLLEHNIAIGAADDGIDVDGPTTTLTGNLAVHNGDLGIEAVAGVTDGGGNTAHGNGNPAQCTIVACR